MRRSHPASRRRGHTGFALLIVLWTLAIVSLIALHLGVTGRGEVRLAGNLLANAQAAAAADGGVYRAIFALSEPVPGRRWPTGGPPQRIDIGTIRVTIRLEDEARKINPNNAPLPLLVGLLRAVGEAPETAPRLAAAIVDWTRAASPARAATTAASRDLDYRRAGLDYAPPHAPLETLDELGRVMGMSPTLLEALKPHLSLYTLTNPVLGQANIDPVVERALVIAGGAGPPAGGAVPDGLAEGLRAIRIEATAVGPGNAAFVRRAVVRFGPIIRNGYAILEWDGGAGES
jgi:general secretion pathway protein K